MQSNSNMDVEEDGSNQFSGLVNAQSEYQSKQSKQGQQQKQPQDLNKQVVVVDNNSKNISSGKLEKPKSKKKQKSTKSKQKNPSLNKGQTPTDGNNQINKLQGGNEITRQQSKTKISSKTIVDINFKHFFPQFLLLVSFSSCKNKHMIRVGKNYQAVVPTKCKFSYKYRSLAPLKVWTPIQFNSQLVKKFKQQFGQSRTEEELCLLMYQYQCSTDQILDYLVRYKSDIKRMFCQRERTKN